MKSGVVTTKAPIFDDELYRCQPHDELLRVGCLSGEIRSRAELWRFHLRAGEDFADDERVTRRHLAQREYHHLFPDHLLPVTRASAQDAYRALNCALVRGHESKDRCKRAARVPARADCGCPVGRRRGAEALGSHLIPYDELAVGGYDQIADSKSRASKIVQDYRRFLLARAEMMGEVMKTLCRGEVWPGNSG